MKILWRAANEGPPMPEEQYQERFCRRRLDGIGLDTATNEFLAIEFNRTQDTGNNYEERATAVAQEKYKSLLAGLQAVGQVKGWKLKQIVFVGGTFGSIHVESFNRNMKALGVLESKWDHIRKKLVRRLLEDQDKVLRSYFAQKGGNRSKGEDRSNGQRRGFLALHSIIEYKKTCCSSVDDLRHARNTSVGPGRRRVSWK
jgi:hypothetical protein